MPQVARAKDGYYRFRNGKSEYVPRHSQGYSQKRQVSRSQPNSAAASAAGIGGAAGVGAAVLLGAGPMIIAALLLIGIGAGYASHKQGARNLAKALGQTGVVAVKVFVWLVATSISHAAEKRLDRKQAKRLAMASADPASLSDRQLKQAQEDWEREQQDLKQRHINAGSTEEEQELWAALAVSDARGEELAIEQSRRPGGHRKSFGTWKGRLAARQSSGVKARSSSPTEATPASSGAEYGHKVGAVLTGWFDGIYNLFSQIYRS
jgi:hypothetical protein